MTAAIAHATRGHRKFSPSAMSRIEACPGSVAASEGLEDRSSSYALEGTAAHELCEHVLNTAIDPEVYLGGVVDLQAPEGAIKFHEDDGLQPEADGERYIEVTDEMVDGVRLYRDFILEQWDEFAGDILELETKLDMSHLHPEFGGTSDAIIYKPKTKTLIVGDLKFGMKVVEPTSAQLLSYAVGAARRVWGGPIDRIVLAIVQPRAFHPAGPVRTAEYTYVELEQAERRLAGVIKAAEQEGAPRNPGDHCTFCKAASFCPELRKYAEDTISGDCLGEEVEKDATGTVVIQNLTPEQVGTLMLRVPTTRNWCKRLEERAYHDAVDGKPPKGFKLVEKKPRRQWRDYNVALATIAESGIDADDYLTERKLKSVAQVEKALGKSRAAVVMRGLWHNNSTGTTLAPESDARTAVVPSAGESFSAVDGED